MNRRSFIQSILAAGVAPAFIGSNILMPVRAIQVFSDVLLPSPIIPPALMAGDLVVFEGGKFRVATALDYQLCTPVGIWDGERSQTGPGVYMVRATPQYPPNGVGT